MSNDILPYVVSDLTFVFYHNVLFLRIIYFNGNALGLESLKCHNFRKQKCQILYAKTSTCIL